ncbi:MAG: hypothetical protein DBX59_04665 [Bacillota bacterium]|nr:MAG: hypothetical protein DBX59_04665 [Bacillota bacterium]
MNNILIAYYSFIEPTISGLNSWIAAFINLFPTIVLGVVMFTLALKLVTFPLDFYSRASMRRNSLKMEQMRPELEKLQKQYADDKQTYQMKMAALYKKEGYSMFGACLPSIVTLVFFIIVLNAFNAYSIHQNVKYLYNMNTAFNSVVDDGLLDVEGYISHDGGKVIIDDAAIYDAAKEQNGGEIGSETIVLTTDPALHVTYEFYAQPDSENVGKVTYFTEGGYIRFPRHIRQNEDGSYYYLMSKDFSLVLENFKTAGLKNDAGQTFSEYYDAAKAENAELTEEAAVELFFKDVQQTRAAEKYREEEESFLWIKNIWMPDTPFQHPVYKDYTTFNQKYKLEQYAPDSGQYEDLTAKLSQEKDEANGYFILVILTAGSSLLMQWIMSRGQKAQMELQSVDGQGMMTQKMMMWMMPIMMGIFAFMYTAAFSVYIIMSSVTSMLTTLLINKVVDVRFKKQMEAEANGTAKPKRRAKVKDAEKSATGKVKGREKISSDKDNRIVKKVVLERTEKGLDDKKNKNGGEER